VSFHIANLYLKIAFCWIPLFVVCTAVSLPVSCYNFYLQRKFGLLRLGIGGWLRDFLKASVLGFLLYVVILEIAYFSHAVFPVYSWIGAGLLTSIFFLMVTRSFPWILSLFYPVVPLENATLRGRLIALANKADMNAGTLFEWRVSGRTRQANALVSGVGATRRILLTDTLIAALSEEEVEAMVAHEFGHCAHHHIAKRLLLQFFIYSSVFWAIDFFIRINIFLFPANSSGWIDLALIPGILFWWYCWRATGNILFARLSRRHEKEADLYSWKLIGRAEPFITAMRKLEALNLVSFEKDKEWKYTHPATSSRLAAAEEFAKANGEVLATPSTTVSIDTV
jgi:STE24 endopeptidase